MKTTYKLKCPECDGKQGCDCDICGGRGMAFFVQAPRNGPPNGSAYMLAQDTIARLTAERDALAVRLENNERAYDEAYMISVAAKNDANALRTERDAAIAQCKAWREEAEAAREMTVATHRGCITNNAECPGCQAADAWLAARARTDAIVKGGGT